MLSDVEGQVEAVRILRRVVDGHLRDPLLLVGEEGVGRRFSTVQAIKEIYCQGERQSTCGCCDCTQINQGFHPDLTIIETAEDKPIKVDTIRETIQLAWKRPTTAPKRFILLDGADRMTSEAANAFLKTLEEPPPTTRFILLTESYQRVIPTIRSRCGKVSYRPLPDSFVLSVLQRFEPDHVKASIYARMGEGSVGRSVSYWGAGQLALRDRVFALLQQALAGDLPGLFSAVDAIGANLPLALRFVEQLLHDLLMVSTAPDRLINLDLQEEAQRVRNGAPLLVWTRLGQGAREIREKYRWTRINLAFHVKALFAEVFFAS